MKEERAQALFWSLVRGLSDNDVGLLIDCGGQGSAGIYLFDEVERSATQLQSQQVPWHLEWFLSKMSRKHLLLPKRCPSSAVGRALADWGNKIFWRAHLDGHEDPWLHLKTKKIFTPQFPHEPSSELATFVAEVSSRVWSTCTRALAQKVEGHSALASGLARWALRTLAQGAWAAVPTDKDGGYCMLKKSLLEQEKLKVMQAAWYREVPLSYFFKKEEVLEPYLLVVRNIFKRTGDAGLKRALLSGVAVHGDKDAICTLQVLVKTHKPAGNVKMRGIHAAPLHPLKPGMRFVAHCLRGFLSRQDHLVKDSHDLLRKVTSKRLSPNIRFYKGDVEDFYMSGVHGDLKNLCMQAVDEDHRTDFEELVEVILSTQFIALNASPSRVWKTITGTGMGLLCSGEMSDTALCKLCEEGFISAPRTAQEFGLEMYYRYRDDILVGLASDSDTRVSFWHELKKRAAFFRIKLDGMSDSEITMLDITFWKDEAFATTGRLQHRVHVKSTSVWTPLAPSSGHSGHVHRSWPAAQVARHRSLCSTALAKTDAERAFVERLAAFGVVAEPTRGIGRSAVPAKADPGSFLALPWHPSLARAKLARVLQEAALSWAPVLGRMARVSIAWRNATAHLHLKVRRTQRLNAQ